MSDLTIEAIKARFNYYVEEYGTGHATLVNSRLKGAAIGVMESLCGGEDVRHAILELLTGISSYTKLSEAHRYAFYKMVDPHRTEEGKWVGRDNLPEIVKILLANIIPQPTLPLLGEPTDVDWDAVKEGAK